MEQTLFTSVSDAAAFLADDNSIKEKVEQEIASSQLVNRLIQLRINKKVSQKELARQMGCDASKLSRMEAGTDQQLRMGDITDYLSALGVHVSLVFEDTTLPAAEQIKQHVFAIHEQLENLANIARQVDGDNEIIEKIHKFYGEVLLNFMLRFSDSHEKLCMVSGYKSATPHKEEYIKKPLFAKPLTN
uniref:Transcriptional regulator, XRE family n=1 Tax=Chlorobium chlorochromatii (strain CaD3) TaxID=340177 RepID=Q3AR54_CHLCH